MLKQAQPQIVSANDLLMGDVVYRTAAGDWSRELRDAAVAETQEAAAALLEAAKADHLQIVGPYLAAVRIGADGPEPTHFREVFRMTGPTFREDLQKRAPNGRADLEML